MIVISATFVAEPLANPLAFMLAELGLSQDIQFAPYHQVFQALLTPGSDFDRNRCGTNIALIRLQDFVREPGAQATACQTVNRVADELGAALVHFASNSPGVLLLAVLPASPEVAADLSAEIGRATAALLARVAGHKSIQLLMPEEIDRLASAQSHDARRDQLAHIPYSDTHFATLALALGRRIHARHTPAPKVLVLDCDNTLWGGVVGEDGIDGIVLTAAYLALQDFALMQQRKGVLLCLASKNSEADVLDVLATRSDMRLRADDVVAYRINWLSKAANLRALALELNLGLDTFVFMDDNPMECAQMRAELPEVLTLQVPPEDGIGQWLDRLWIFDQPATTAEDATRSRLYRENTARRSLASRVGSIDEFLAALELQLDIQTPGEDEWPRIEQLTQRTNQFNFTTRRRTVQELKSLWQQGAQVLRVRVRDRFGDYGLVGVLVAQVAAQALVIDTFLLSCRVLGRGVEHAMLRSLGEHAHAQGLAYVELEWIHSTRNQPAQSFADSVAAAFREHEGGGYRYRIPVAQAADVQHRPGADTAMLMPADLADNASPLPATAADRVVVARSERYTRLSNVLVCGAALQHALSLQRRQRRMSSIAVPAASAIEERLKNLWEALLSIDGIGVEDDYFALGGTSVQSVQLFSEIEHHFGVALRLTTILAAPTVRQLAGLIESAAAPISGGMVPLRTGGRDNLFLVHDGLGETLLYLHLARRLPGTMSVFGIEPRRLPGIPLAHTSMDALAADYVAQIQSIQPAGPYRLGGMCAGGVIAYAMATRLRALGEPVEVVTIMDGACSHARQRPRRVAGHRLARLRELLHSGGAPDAPRLSVLALAGAVWSKACHTLHYEAAAWWARKSAQWRFRLLQALLKAGRPWPRWIPELSVAQIYTELDARYEPPPLTDVAVLLVRASQGEAADLPHKEIYQDDDFGWQQVASHVTLADVSGGHSSMLQERHVDSLTAALLAHQPGWAHKVRGSKA